MGTYAQKDPEILQFPKSMIQKGVYYQLEVVTVMSSQS